MNKTKIFSLVIVAIFALSAGANSAMLSGQAASEVNFTLDFFIPSGSRRDESYALYTKQALAPLGIEIKVFAKPWGQFVGELLGYSGQQFDLATVGFTNGAPTPSLAWMYSSGGSWAFMANIDNDEFTKWQLEDVGLNQTTDIDSLVLEMEFELNISRRYELFAEFNEMYFTKLLWNAPLVAQFNKVAMWRGFGGANNELWNIQEGTITSRALGAAWDPDNTPAGRKSNATTYKSAIASPVAKTFDPNYVRDSAHGALTGFTMDGLVTFDEKVLPHPSLAWNFFFANETPAGYHIDYDRDWSQDGLANATEGETNLNVTRATFFIRDDVNWPAIDDPVLGTFPAHQLDANDFALQIDNWRTAAYDDDYDINGEEWVTDYYAGHEVSTTFFPDDTLTIWFDQNGELPDMLVNINQAPMPSHIFNEGMITNGTHTEMLKPGISFDPFDSIEYQRWVAANGTAWSQVGAYEPVEWDATFYTFGARDDYWYPTEADVAAYNTKFDIANDAEATALETKYDVDFSLWGMGIEDWALNDLSQESYYWAFADDANTAAFEKPTSQGLESYTLVVIDDVNTRLIEFESGNLDTFGSSALGAEVVSNHEDNDDLVVADFIPNSGARQLFFNTLNEHLKKFNVRLAITKAMDREKLVAIHDGLGQAWWNLAYPNKQTGKIIWDEVQNPIPFSYEEARDLMRAEGYSARDSNEDISTANIPDVNEAFGLLGNIGSEMYLLFAAFSMVAVVFVRKRKY